MEPVYLRAAALLRELEWADDGAWCPSCRPWAMNTHEQDCELVAMIRELEAMEGTAAKVQRKEKACSSR